MLENIIYEKDYAEEKAQRVANTPEIHSKIFDHAVSSGFFKAYNDALKALPKYIVPADKEAYEDLLPRLDILARKWGGHIKGVVDYEKWESYITVILPFFECDTPEDHELLADIAKKTHLFSITATDDGNVRLYIMINYFDEIGDKENLIEETILKDEKLVELLEQKHEDDKKVALSHPEIGAFLEKNASSMGMTADELYDMIDYACTNHPEIIAKLFSSQGENDEENEDEE